MKLPNAEQATVEREKVTEYLLSTTNPSGRSKALFFLRFGFSTDSWEDFAESLRLQASANDVVRIVETIHGPRYSVDGTIVAPDGRTLLVRTVWQFDLGSEYPRLITAHPRGR